MGTVLSIFLLILILSVLIIAHEWGHFIAARLCKIRVNEFAIGMGPAIFKKKRKDTVFSLRAFPIGGFCAMEGEDDQSQDPHAFPNRPLWQRFIVLIAGSFMNLLLGLVLMFIYILPHQAYETTVVRALDDGYAAVEDGLMPGDRILSINGEHLYSAVFAGLFLERSQDGLMDIVFIRDGQKIKLNDFYMGNPQGRDRYGIHFKAEAYTLGSRITMTFKRSAEMVQLVKMTLGDLITGRAGMKELAGPVGMGAEINTVVTDTDATTREKTNYLVFFSALIAINLAVMNLLPLPALDGGRCIFLLIELIFRKPVPAKYEGLIHGAGLLLFFGLMIFVFINDILRIVGR